MYRHIVLNQMLAKLVPGNSHLDCIQNLELAEKQMSKGIKCKDSKKFRDNYFPCLEDLDELDSLIISTGEK